MKLNAVKFGLALGIVWAAGMFILGLMTMFWGWGDGMLDVMSSLYIGYSGTWLGSIIGLVWGFVDAFVGGLIVALIYNKLVG